MDKKIIMDTDILSSFTSVGKLDELIRLFQDRVLVPDVVLDELANLKNNYKLKYIYEEVLKNIEAGKLEIFEIIVGTKEFEAFLELTNLDSMKLGDGEAACLAIALTNDRIISSSNLKDVGFFVDNRLVENIPTTEILKRFHTEMGYPIEEVDKIKDLMVKKGRKLPAQSIRDL